MITVKNLVNKIKKYKQDYFQSKYKKYVVDYKEDNKFIYIISNDCRTKKVYNTLENKEKIENTIKDSQKDIENRIIRYDDTGYLRKKIILINLGTICASGVSVPLAFFTGLYPIFLLSIAIFFLATLFGIITGIEISIKSEEIKELKNKSGYINQATYNIKYNTINKLNKMRE